jgi:hypothetical protein
MPIQAGGQGTKITQRKPRSFSGIVIYPYANFSFIIISFLSYSHGRLSSLSRLFSSHYWATQAARNNPPIDRLQEAGGWNSPAMPLRYGETAKIANEGVNLG